MLKQQETADREASDCDECNHESEDGTEMQEVGTERGKSAEQSEHVKPDQGTCRRSAWSAKTKLQQGCRQSDRRDDHDSERATKCRSPRIKHDKRQRAQQKTGGDHGPATREIREWLGQGRVSRKLN